MNKTFSNFKTPQRKKAANNWGSMSGRQCGKKITPNRDYDISFISGLKSMKSTTKRGSNTSIYKEKYSLPNAHLELTASE